MTVVHYNQCTAEPSFLP